MKAMAKAILRLVFGVDFENDFDRDTIGAKRWNDVGGFFIEPIIELIPFMLVAVLIALYYVKT
ncbi:hypothetical protein IJG93_00320 [Candidatus Saccharibacteria bacterium]|nr:hypothetical protein [Candidatus Saccharibacteria bacterium]